jgi:hypothetical protein
MSLARRRTEFAANKERLPDQEFLERIRASPELGIYALAIRRVIAVNCGIEPELIHDTDDPVAINAILELDIGGGWDALVFEMCLEKELDTPISCEGRLPSLVGKGLFGWKERPPRSFGEWTLDVAKRVGACAREPDGGNA